MANSQPGGIHLTPEQWAMIDRNKAANKEERKRAEKRQKEVLGLRQDATADEIADALRKRYAADAAQPEPVPPQAPDAGAETAQKALFELYVDGAGVSVDPLDDGTVTITSVASNGSGIEKSYAVQRGRSLYLPFGPMDRQRPLEIGIAMTAQGKTYRDTLVIETPYEDPDADPDSIL